MPALRIPTGGSPDSRGVIIWLDAHLPPGICPWLESQFGVTAEPVRDLGLRHAADLEIFFAARAAGAVVMTKDVDFTFLLERHGPPPSVLWLTGGNTSAARLQEVLATTLTTAIELLEAGELLVEISCRK